MMNIIADNFHKLNTGNNILFVSGAYNEIQIKEDYSNFLNFLRGRKYRNNIEYKIFNDNIPISKIDSNLMVNIKKALSNTQLEEICKAMYNLKILDFGIDAQNRIIVERFYDVLIEYQEFYNYNEIEKIFINSIHLFLEHATNGLEVVIYNGNIKINELIFLKWISMLGVKIVILDTLKSLNIQLKNVHYLDLPMRITVDNTIKEKNNENSIFLPETLSSQIIIKHLELDSLENTINSFDKKTSDRIGYLKLPKAHWQTIFKAIVNIQNEESPDVYADRYFVLNSKLNIYNAYSLIYEKVIPPTFDEIQSLSKIKTDNINDFVSQLNFSLTKSSEYNELLRIVFNLTVNQFTKNENLTIEKKNTLFEFIKKIYIWLKRENTQINNLVDNGIFPKRLIFNHYSKHEYYYYKMLSMIGYDILFVYTSKSLIKESVFMQSEVITLSEIENVLEFPKNKYIKPTETIAKKATSEIENLLYNVETKMFKPGQMDIFNPMPLILKTTFEEIPILWKEEARYRPGFNVLQKDIVMPAIFTKIDGIHENSKQYMDFFNAIKKDAIYIHELSINPINQDSEFFKLGFLFDSKEDLIVDELLSHQYYKYNYLKIEKQHLMVEKLKKILLPEKYNKPLSKKEKMLAIAMFLNLEDFIIEKIESYDFPFLQPKLIYFSNSQEGMPLRDVFLMNYLNEMGFDIVILTPSKYRNIERYLKNDLITIHTLAVQDRTLSYDCLLQFKNEEQKNSKFFSKLFKL